jgi:glycosyltransferase involved in cell wall biosynthesis
LNGACRRPLLRLREAFLNYMSLDLFSHLSSLSMPAGRTVRVLFALPGLHRVNRGAEVAFEELARQIGATPGLEVTVIGSGAEREGEPYQGRRARCIARERFEGWPSVPYLRDHFAYEELSFVPGLMGKYSPGEFDITVTCGYPYTNWALRARRRGQFPRHVFVTQNGDWMVHSGQREYRFFSCDGLVCTNVEYFERNRRRFPSVLIPNGVNADVFYPGPADRKSLGLPELGRIVLMVSALSASKRVVEGIRCAAKVPDVHLVICGDGEQRSEVREAGERLLGGRFTMMTLPRQRMPELYRAADVFLHMSQDEPSSNAYLEALASGLPIVTHDRVVTQWTFEDQATLVDTSDESAVAAAIDGAFKLKTAAHVAARRDLVDRRFGWKAIAEQYCNFFERLVLAAANDKQVASGELALGANE